MKTLALSFFITTATALAAPSAFSADNAAVDKTLELAAKDAQKQRSIDYAIAPIKSEADLQSYLHSKPANSPLNKLSPGALKRFASSVEFNEKGVTTYDYSDLRAELSAKQVYAVLSLFGIQGTTSVIPGLRVEDDADRAVTAPGGVTPQLYPDYNDFKCESRATCSAALQKICTSNC